jgi:hypothetical protein
VEVPVFWHFNSQACRAHQPRLARMIGRSTFDTSHEHVDKTLFGLIGLNDPQIYDAGGDLGAEQYRPGPRLAVNRRRQVIDVDDYLSRFDSRTHCPMGESALTLGLR